MSWSSSEHAYESQTLFWLENISRSSYINDDDVRQHSLVSTIWVQALEKTVWRIGKRAWSESSYCKSLYG